MKDIYSEDIINFKKLYKEVDFGWNYKNSIEYFCICIIFGGLESAKAESLCKEIQEKTINHAVWSSDHMYSSIVYIRPIDHNECLEFVSEYIEGEDDYNDFYELEFGDLT